MRKFGSSEVDKEDLEKNLRRDLYASGVFMSLWRTANATPRNKMDMNAPWAIGFRSTS